MKTYTTETKLVFFCPNLSVHYKLTKQGKTGIKLDDNISSKTPVGKKGHKTGTDTGKHNPELQLTTKNTDAIIGGRKFTGHALDKMQSRGIISPSAVSDTINNPIKVFPGRYK